MKLAELVLVETPKQKLALAVLERLLDDITPCYLRDLPLNKTKRIKTRLKRLAKEESHFEKEFDKLDKQYELALSKLEAYKKFNANPENQPKINTKYNVKFEKLNKQFSEKGLELDIRRNENDGILPALEYLISKENFALKYCKDIDFDIKKFYLLALDRYNQTGIEHPEFLKKVQAIQDNEF